MWRWKSWAHGSRIVAPAGCSEALSKKALPKPPISIPRPRVPPLPGPPGNISRLAAAVVLRWGMAEEKSAGIGEGVIGLESEFGEANMMSMRGSRSGFSGGEPSSAKKRLVKDGGEMKRLAREGRRHGEEEGNVDVDIGADDMDLENVDNDVDDDVDFDARATARSSSGMDFVLAIVSIPL
ncbi:hypothetical protein AA313_de0204087 [Arthrobotrys entomopaga]|nr:hypothetical protein AA313_de0204087 [Arthrobotrys entomopaga]